jgi:DNA uptake protein ComE-like DNA-binding protein
MLPIVGTAIIGWQILSRFQNRLGPADGTMATQADRVDPQPQPAVSPPPAPRIAEEPASPQTEPADIASAQGMSVFPSADQGVSGGAEDETQNVGSIAQPAPTVEQSPAQALPSEPAVPTGPSRTDEARAAEIDTVNGPVDLNSASLEQLNALGAGRIGRAIIGGRPYRTAEDLLTKRVLRRSVYERIKGQVTVASNRPVQ